MDTLKKQELFDKICMRMQQYMKEKRANTQPQKLADQLAADSAYKYDPMDERVQEGLDEHVGLLPILATTIYPYLDRTDVDLGEALIMLAIHDIGETVTGDKITFLKNDKEAEDEQQIALGLLDPIYHERYELIENPSTPTSRFAKSMDKTVADFLDYICPADVTLTRYNEFMQMQTPKEIIDMKRRHKAKHFEWDSQLKDFFEYILEKTEEKLTT